MTNLNEYIELKNDETTNKSEETLTLKISPLTDPVKMFYTELNLEILHDLNHLILRSSKKAKILKADPLIVIKITSNFVSDKLKEKYHSFCSADIKTENLDKTLKKEIESIEKLKKYAETPFFFYEHVEKEKDQKCFNKYIYTSDPLGNMILFYLAPQEISSIGVLTSGGDSPGMNSCLRAIIRTAIRHNIVPYKIYEGYKGLIENRIHKAFWSDAPAINEGGTSIKSARSMEFKEQLGRIKGTINLLMQNISSLIVLGGDGSFKGVEILHDEWNQNCQIIQCIISSMQENINLDNNAHDENCIKNCPCNPESSISFYNSKSYDIKIENLVLSNSSSVPSSEDKLNNNEKILCNEDSHCEIKKFIRNSNFSIDILKDKLMHRKNQLKVIGIPSTIDNDIPLCVSLGFDTALHRVVESVDNLIFTMASHNRAFIVEVMGRDCGYIAAMSGLALNADYILCPEVQNENWRTELLISVLSENKKIFKTNFDKKNLKIDDRSCKKDLHSDNSKEIIIVLSEGFSDKKGPVSANQIKDLLNPFIDTRIITLGHLQRGGRPSAMDRLQGTFLGVKAIETLVTCDYTKLACIFSCDTVSTDKKINLLNKDEHEKIFDKNFNFFDFFSEKYILHLKNKREKEKKKSNWGYKIAKLDELNSLTKHLKDLVDNKKYNDLLKYRGRMFIEAIEVFDNLRLRKSIKGQELELCPCINEYNRSHKKSINCTHEFKNYALCSRKFHPYNIEGMVDPHLEEFKEEDFNEIIKDKDEKRIGIVLEGYRCSGMHIALKTIIKYSSISSHSISLVHDGFNGLLSDRIEKLPSYLTKNMYKNYACEKYQNLSENHLYIGTSSLKNMKIDKNYALKVLKKLKEHKISGLVIIGSSSCLSLMEYMKRIQKKDFSYKIDIVMIPLSISDNIPLTDSIGLDTSLNSIVGFTDILSKTRTTFHNTVNLVELGGTTGFLCMLAGLASGAVENILGEKDYRNADITEISTMLKRKFIKNDKHNKLCDNNQELCFECTQVQKTGLLILRQKSAISHISSSSLSSLIKSDSDHIFRSEYCVLGQLERGGDTSPKDRMMSVVMGIKSFNLLTKEVEKERKIGVLSLQGDHLQFLDIKKIMQQFDKKTNKKTNKKWVKYSNLCRWLE